MGTKNEIEEKKKAEAIAEKMKLVGILLTIFVSVPILIFLCMLCVIR